MKIKEAAERTGLTEKAIRFYESKRLITPQTYELNGRVFREYTEENIRELKMIAVLRQAFFSVGQIQEMLCDKSRVPKVFCEYRESLCADYAEKTPLMERLRDIDAEKLRDIGDVAESLSEETKVIPKPRELRISRVDDSPDREREAEYCKFLQRQHRRDIRDSILSVLGRSLKLLVITAAVLIVILTAVFVISNIRIIKPVSVTLDAIEWSEGDPDILIPRTITLTGESEHYIFRDDTVTLDMAISGYGLNSLAWYLPTVRFHRSSLHPAEGWKCGAAGVMDVIYDIENEAMVLIDKMWISESAGYGYFLICEEVSPSSYTYDPNSRSRIITFGVDSREEAELIRCYSKLEDRKATEKRLEELYGAE